MRQLGKERRIMTVPYKNNEEHLGDELRKLDLLIRRGIIILSYRDSQTRQISMNPGLYVSHEEVEALLKGPGPGAAAPPASPLQEINRAIKSLESQIRGRVRASVEAGVFLALPRLAGLFNLLPFEQQALVICLAPELRRKYDKLYVYLQDDIARKKPSIDLILELLCAGEEEQWKARSYFTPRSPLFRAELLRRVEDVQSPSGSSGLAQFLQLSPRIFHFLVGDTGMDEGLRDAAALLYPSVPLEKVLIDSQLKDRVTALVTGHLEQAAPGGKSLVLHLHGPGGVGKQELALGICGLLKCPLLRLDLEQAAARGENRAALPRLAFREALLQGAVLYIDTTGAGQAEAPGIRDLFNAVSRLAGEHGGFIFIAGPENLPCTGLFKSSVFYSLHLPVPGVPLRQKAWEAALQELVGAGNSVPAEGPAPRFRLTPGQIRDAVESANYRYILGNGHTRLTPDHLASACREQSNQRLGESAKKIEPRYTWGDIVLGREKSEQLKEICNQEKHRHTVFNRWGFRDKLSHGRGLSVLFSGPPGTGKTMAADVLAGELGLDLYKVDLSGVVSKYIGETEKNLSRIFREAETANGILFFDEADALFGKRTEVSDAHDRYANIETSYLLQKMEEYEGMVILATNFRKNMDDAFVRRIRFIVEFPFPDEESRRRIWETHFPGHAPVSEHIDYSFLAKQVRVAGGNIRNIVLNAAFLAAGDGGIINMEHLLMGTRREFEKIGKLWDEKSMRITHEDKQ